MKKPKLKILQEHFSIDRRNNIDNYLVLIEMVDNVVKRSYVVRMHEHKYWDKVMKFYVINGN